MTTTTLRPYQREAVDAVWAYLRGSDLNPAVVQPTGSGKTLILAELCREAVQTWNGRVVVLAHVKELLEQAVEKLKTLAPDLPVGVYSAGLRQRDLGYAITVAGIQSIYKRACELDAIDLVIIDEAHMVPPEGDGMYRQFLADARTVNPHVRIVGLTATPYRMSTGTICTPPPDGILNEICYETGVRELIVQGYLCPLRTKAGSVKADFQGLHVRAGEFVAGEVEDLMDEDRLVEAACAEIIEQTQDRHSVLVFSSGVNHGSHIVRILEHSHGVECGFVTGETPGSQRALLLDRFRSGDLKYLCNVNVLTTGFDAPNVDCVAMLRPTMSPGLYYQAIGRGLRLHPDKEDCLVLDFGGNVLRHGPVDQIRIGGSCTRGDDGDAPAKECPECQALIAAGYARCPDCGYEFPPPDRQKHDARASNAGILTGQVTTTEHPVRDVFFSVHIKRNAELGAPSSMRVEYQIGLNDYISEWICFEHSGYARAKAVQWWRKRSNDPVPTSAEAAVDLCERGCVAETHAIKVRSVAGEKFDRIVNWQLGPIPPRLDGSDDRDDGTLPAFAPADDEIPF